VTDYDKLGLMHWITACVGQIYVWLMASLVLCAARGFFHAKEIQSTVCGRIMV